ncbi:HAMP domain-containing histidine kinase [Neobacillus terrae]|uniref:HAMP domain-containing histidine kinase n=1 Tax=Neobacillus terrae TaxID=3034837 RepID=UPI00140E2B65|nr:HAMP domain-containing histidine kinase [Neobacillus terrae]NHM29391.1 HAMP domain-containing histidine kinase [Neobacillus terrae]
MKKPFFFFKKMPWRSKLILSSSTAIFFTFFIVNFLQFHMVSKWMLKREEASVHKTLSEITSYYKEKENRLDVAYIQKNSSLLNRLNDKNQLIRVYDNKGKVIISDKNGNFPTLEPLPASEKTLDHITSEENETIVVRTPINTRNFHGTIEIVRELTSYGRMMDELFIIMTTFGIAAILFSALTGFILAKQFLTPVRELTLTMKRIKENRFQERMVVPEGNDELADLSNIFNDMMDEIESSFLQQKQFVEDASHELRTPISILEGHVALLNRWGKKDEAILDESLSASMQELSRLKKLVFNLLDLTRAENSRIMQPNEKTDPELIIHQVVKNFEVLHPDFELVAEIKQPLDYISIFSEHLQQILIILMDNSVKYSQRVKTIVVSAKQKGDLICIEVIDNGIGIPPDEVSKVFNRFYRIDKARSREKGGTGLGLSIAKRLVEKYNGTISIDSEEGKGTIVEILFPSIKN